MSFAHTWRHCDARTHRDIQIGVLAECNRAVSPAARSGDAHWRPFALTDEFLTDGQKMQLWKAFAGRLNAGDKALTLAEVGTVLREFLVPCLSSETATAQGWTPTIGKDESDI